ncbi:MAG: response regulator transcription factor, partial [Pirellulales bacterium]|nr:response regulator transcription factor [Pirellulales bacterium]
LIQAPAPGPIVLSKDRILGLLAKTIGKLDESEAHFAQALEVCGNLGCRPELAWTHRDYVELLLAFDDAEHVKRRTSLIENGLALAQEMGMRPLEDKLLEIQGRLDKITAHPDGLTEREVEILREIAKEKTNKEIADTLSISVKTVHTHTFNIYGKIGCGNRTEAAAYAISHGLAKEEDEL